MKEALDAYFDDIEDYYIALDRVSDPKREFLTTDQVIQELSQDEGKN